MTTQADRQQLSICGGTMAEQKFKELLAKYPIPQTVKQSEAFFRAKAVTTLTMKEDKDVLRVVLKGTDSEEDLHKFEVKAELCSTDRERWEKRFIQAAQDMHAHWLRLEQQKQ